jgi:hypothetical protein
MFTEPLAGWREVSVRERRTKANWATEMAQLLEGRYAGCEKVIVVCDQLRPYVTKLLLGQPMSTILSEELIGK